ncbi:alpha/beta hydrolase [Diplocloster agilis]|uniref:Alpha/beta hydrolase n=1 Tax=Diplocloster agilis TaxID=2850323 RepID=A0A949NAZ2_9FIRM|nr:alpha/beta hydrolase [Diplocloster agilis]MBU9737012.1 alpha/beta hydrolase [Diplocloster agilis]
MWSMIIALIVFIGVAVCTIFPPSLGNTKPFRDESGYTLQDSISEKLIVDINNTSFGMFIMGKDTGKPILLFLGGGPGIPEYFLETQYPSGLENEFVVCYLEYRGTSLSYHPDILSETITTEQYIQDAVEVTNYLRERFGQNKIYLMGHSFGTYIGVLTASRHPKLYKAYIGMSQITNQEKSEELAYSYMLEQYQLSKDTKMISAFESYPIFTDESAYTNYFNSSLRDTSMHELGVGTMHNMNSVITGIFFPSLRCRVYTPFERINIWRGKAFVKTSPAVADAARFNAFLEVPALDIPIYFFAGIYDYTCSYSLQKEYFDQIQAPIKAFYTFSHSAHSPLFEEPDKARLILREDVLTGRIDHADTQ